MAGWTCRDNKTNEWDGTLKSDDIKVDNTASIATGIITSDFTASSSAYIANVLYGTGDTPPTASSTPIGTIYIQYTP